MQLVTPDEYAKLALPDQFIEDWMQVEEARLILHHLQDAKTVLEMGYGSGIIARALRDAGKEVTVIEGAEASCKTAALEGINAIHTRFEDFTPTRDYDCVIASFILEHVIAPTDLLKRAREWSNRLLCVVGNAESYHRQIAVKMGLIPTLDTLSERDKIVGHFRVYDFEGINHALHMGGWTPAGYAGIMLKALPNSMLAKLPREVVKAMMSVPVDPRYAANILVDCTCRPL